MIALFSRRYGVRTGLVSIRGTALPWPRGIACQILCVGCSLRGHYCLVIAAQVVPIKDSETRAKIHQTYRIGYIKDVILPRVLDDATFATLASLMLFNNVEVLMSLQVHSLRASPPLPSNLYPPVPPLPVRQTDGRVYEEFC